MRWCRFAPPPWGGRRSTGGEESKFSLVAHRSRREMRRYKSEVKVIHDAVEIDVSTNVVTGLPIALAYGVLDQREVGAIDKAIVISVAGVHDADEQRQSVVGRDAIGCSERKRVKTGLCVA